MVDKKPGARDKNFLKYLTLCSNEQAKGREIAVRLMIR